MVIRRQIAGMSYVFHMHLKCLLCADSTTGYHTIKKLPSFAIKSGKKYSDALGH